MRRRCCWLVVAGVAIAGAVVFCARYVEHVSHREWYHRVQDDFVGLADKPPPDVSRGQWEFMLNWTIQLHANCAASPAWIERADRERFVEEFEQRMRGPVSAATIDWIWYEYARITRYGQEYS